MSKDVFQLDVLPEQFAVCRLGAAETIPEWCQSGTFSSITRTASELSVVCEESVVPMGVMAERGWRILRLAGPLDLALVGILAALARILAEAEVAIFAISSYDTDYILVQHEQLGAAVSALVEAGHTVNKE